MNIEEYKNLPLEDRITAFRKFLKKTKLQKRTIDHYCTYTRRMVYSGGQKDMFEISSLEDLRNLYSSLDNDQVYINWNKGKKGTYTTSAARNHYLSFLEELSSDNNQNREDNNLREEYSSYLEKSTKLKKPTRNNYLNYITRVETSDGVINLYNYCNKNEVSSFFEKWKNDNIFKKWNKGEHNNCSSSIHFYIKFLENRHNNYDGIDSTEESDEGTNKNISDTSEIETKNLNKYIADLKDAVKNWKEGYPSVIQLLNSHNLIFTGAPGTGKSFLSREIAQTMILGRYVKDDPINDIEDSKIKGQCRFVQFHPSYDYTDFVEGLRPVNDQNSDGEIKFERKDGVFKEFCKIAASNPCNPYIFIIDEINRGEVNKIFGELFYSIDPGYRGKKGKVYTQYQNLIEDNDLFKDGFYVPENVYIIGTMNDIDRSVESMDFAFRRRFAWKEISADETRDSIFCQLNESLIEPAKQRMTFLNKAIAETIGSSYQIGASYFLKLKDFEGNEEEKFKMLWDYHLNGILEEYLRGRRNSEKVEIMESFTNAYYMNNSTNEDNETEDN